mgnify:CR=1 FL=1
MRANREQGEHGTENASSCSGPNGDPYHDPRYWPPVSSLAEQVAKSRSAQIAIIPPYDPALVPLTKERAMVDTVRALKECFPDRWERIWAALGKESAADRAAMGMSKVATANPAMAVGALVGAVIGAALGKSAERK